MIISCNRHLILDMYLYELYQVFNLICSAQWNYSNLKSGYNNKNNKQGEYNRNMIWKITNEIKYEIFKWFSDFKVGV